MHTYCFFSSCRPVPRDFSRLFTPHRVAYGRSSRGLAIVALALMSFASTPGLARAEDMVNVKGYVYADDGKTPLGDADVAIVNDKNKVVANGKTDAEGRYLLPVPRKYLHFPAGKKRSSFLGGLAEGLVGEAIGFVNPIAGMGYETVKGLSGMMKHSGASQADIARMSAGRVTPEDGARLIAAGARKQDVEKMLKYSAENFDGEGNFIPPRNAPGALSLKVALSGHKEANGVGQIYWMQTDKVRAENGHEKRETNAWLDPLLLVPDNAETSSRFTRSYFTLTDAHLDPATVEARQTVTLTVTLSVPPEQSSAPLVVIARHSKTHKIYELTPMDAGGVYRCQIEVDKTFPQKDQLISVVAYPQKAEKPGRDARVEHALEEAGVWKLDKPYLYNPLLLASRNRADVLLTVVKPSRKDRTDAGESYRGRGVCGAGPDRMAPMILGMLGKPVTLAVAPLNVLATALKLDAAQKKRIEALQNRVDKEIATASKEASRSGGFAIFSKMTEIVAQADKDIEAELTAEQKPQSVTLLQSLTLLRDAGLPPDLYIELKLTEDQMKSLTDSIPDIKLENKARSKEMMAAGQAGDMKRMQGLMNKLGDKVSSILTKPQRTLVENYRKKHPQLMTPGVDLGGLPGA